MSDHSLTRIAIVSEQAIYLRGLEAFVLSMPAMRLVGEARSCSETLQLCHLCEPELLLLDLRQPCVQGRELINQIHERWPAIKIILFLDADEENQLQDEFDTLPLYSFSREVSEEEFKEAMLQVQHDVQRTTAQQRFQHQEHPESEAETREALRRMGPMNPLRNEEVLTRELVTAGKIQADILPESPPHVPGWEITARLQPARETSGDFYDFIPLTDRKWGIVVADVTDKGMGAALFMALASTLMRTYAIRFPALPAVTFNAVNERILSDTRGGMFVTTFFGVLEPHTGRLVYVNAGHPPGHLINAHKESVERLQPTGMALGVSEQALWRQKVVKLWPGDFLALYTDGITEAQNQRGDFFGEERLADVLLGKIGCPAGEVQEALLTAVHRFVGAMPRQDDIGLIVIRRKE